MPTLTIDRALSIQGWMEPRELEWLAEQASTHHRIVEVGSFLGRSTRALADATPGTVLAFDDWAGPRDANVEKVVGDETWQKSSFTEFADHYGLNLFQMFTRNLEDHLETGKVKVLRGDHGDPSILPVEFLRGPESEKPDMVFIDGHHGYEEAHQDMLIWKHRLAKGGLLCGHDICWEGVFSALTKLFPNSWISVPHTTLWYING